MSAFTFHESSKKSVAELLMKAAETDVTLPEDAVVITFCWGPPIAGRYADWKNWQLAEGVDDLTIPSSLNDGDPDDLPYASRSGLIAKPAGSSTVYVFTDDAAKPTSPYGDVIAICGAAKSDVFAPRGHLETPIPANVLELRAQIADAMRTAGIALRDVADRVRGMDVYATPDWVQIEGDDLATLLVEPGGSLLSVSYLTEVYVDGLAASEAEKQAETATEDDFEPHLVGLGFARNTAHASTSEEDEHAGADVVDWVVEVSTAPEVAALVQALRGLQNPSYVEFEE